MRKENKNLYFVTNQVIIKEDYDTILKSDIFYLIPEKYHFTKLKKGYFYIGHRIIYQVCNPVIDGWDVGYDTIRMR